MAVVVVGNLRIVHKVPHHRCGPDTFHDHNPEFLCELRHTPLHLLLTSSPSDRQEVLCSRSSFIFFDYWSPEVVLFLLSFLVII